METQNNKYPENERPLIVFLQENAGNLGYRLPFFKIITKELGVNILAIAYRGYSYSDGTPSEKGLQLDAKAITNFLK